MTKRSVSKLPLLRTTATIAHSVKEWMLMINPQLQWQKPQKLQGFPYRADLAQVPATAGVYVFYRNYGSSFEVLYVGKALNLRHRIKVQMNNLKLMNGIKAASNGARMLAYGEIALRSGQSKDTAIVAAEKLLIRHFVEDGHELLNIQGVKRRVQALSNVRPAELKKIIPIHTQIEA